MTTALATARAVTTRIQVRRVQLLLVERPLLNTLGRAFRDAPRHRCILVRLEDVEGVTGWGEVPVIDLPAYAANSCAGSWQALTKLLVPRALGSRFEGPGELAGTWADVQGFHYAKHGLESAAWAIASEKSGRSLAALWGGVRDRIPVGESIGIKETLDDLVDEVGLRVSEGYLRIKLKVAPGWDLAPLSEIAARFPGVPLSADANCHYPTAGTGPFAAMDELGLQMIEQPLPADSLSELAYLQSSLRTPICLDESAASPGLTRAALRLGAGRIVNLKPARLGGLLASLEVHDHCLSEAVPAWCGGMLESGIGRGFNLALCSLPGLTLAADMSPARIFFGEDLVEPTYDLEADGHMPVPAGLGCGFTVREDRVRRCTTATWSSR